MKKFVIILFLLIIPIYNLFFLLGCSNNTNLEKTQSTTDTNSVISENTIQSGSTEIKRVSYELLNNQYTEEFNKPGAYLIAGSNEQAVVIVGKGNSITGADAKIKGDTAIINYYTDLNTSGNLSIYKDVFYISNCKNIKYVNVFLNKKQNHFISSILSDGPILNR